LEKFPSGYTSRNTCTLRRACVAQRIRRTATAREVPGSSPADRNKGKSSKLGVNRGSSGKRWGTQVVQRARVPGGWRPRMRLRSPQKLSFKKKFPKNLSKSIKKNKKILPKTEKFWKTRKIRKHWKKTEKTSQHKKLEKSKNKGKIRLKPNKIEKLKKMK
jgi:hypothetical protein